MSQPVAAAGRIQLSLEWDYLIVTASNKAQAEAYRKLIGLRERLKTIRDFRKILVVPDPEGRRVGSGGSTVRCLKRILELERGDPNAFARLRVLIVHAGGDSRRLPPYGPCGKIFVPVPGDSESALGATLFDRLVPTYARLPLPASAGGQVVVASGDVLLDFDAAAVAFSGRGITGVGALVTPEVARNHGVFCLGEGGVVRRFLQKPSVEKQIEKGATDPHNQSVLDVGILNLDPDSAIRLIGMFPEGREHKEPAFDIYREICCALGTETDSRGYIGEVRASGSAGGDADLRAIYRGLRSVSFRVHIVPEIRFLHFGTLPDLIESGRALLDSETGVREKGECVIIDSKVSGKGAISGKSGWVEGCRIEAPLALAGDNVIVGADIVGPLSLPRGASFDVIEGRDRRGRRGWFASFYATDDALHRAAGAGGFLCGLPVLEWIEAIGGTPAEVWRSEVPDAERTVWSARLFPLVRSAAAFRHWLFLLNPRSTTEEQRKSWLGVDRYSLKEIAGLANLDAFHSRRQRIRGDLVRANLPRVFGPEGELSAEELAFLVRRSEKHGRTGWIVAILREAIRDGSLGRSRVLHTLGTMLERTAVGPDLVRALEDGLTSDEKKRLREMGLPLDKAAKPAVWATSLKEAAFRHMGRTIVTRTDTTPAPPRNVLRSDEIVWGRAPARLDLGGGWTDTPPYSLERGGCVINAAVDLNGQAPIQAYARVIGNAEVRINSIDHSTRVVVRDLDDLLDYRRPGCQFALAKAAMALSGFSPEAASWPKGAATLDQMLRRFGGGIELTTLAAIPSGSGLGTSSIMGAVLMSVIGRVIGRPLASRELFHAVMKLEQELTTGGGWQDQIGGVVEGVKMIASDKGLVPDPKIQFIPADLLDPAANGGRTLLYYTGLRRLAKNILHDVVGRYLDRDRGAMTTLSRLRAFPPLMAEAMAMRDAERFGALIDLAWKLNVDLDPDHTSPVIEGIRKRVRPHVAGAKLLGAGGGGFLLMSCRTPEDAAAVRRMLEKRPPNDKARFFDYSINRTGLVVTIC